MTATVVFRMWNRGPDIRGTVVGHRADRVLIKRQGYRETYDITAAHLAEWRVDR